MKLSVCTALFLLPLLAGSAVAEEFALPDLTVQQPKHKPPQSATGDKAPGLATAPSKWQPDPADKVSKAFTPRSDFCGGCEVKVRVRQETFDERLRLRHESLE